MMDLLFAFFVIRAVLQSLRPLIFIANYYTPSVFRQFALNVLPQFYPGN